MPVPPAAGPKGDARAASYAPRMMTVVFGSALLLLAGVSALSYRNAQRALEDARLASEMRETVERDLREAADAGVLNRALLGLSVTGLVLVGLAFAALVRQNALQRDISERKRLELTLRESEALIRATLDAMLEGCQIIAFDWRYLYVNEVAAAQGRQSRDGLIGRTMMEAYPGIEGTETFAALRRSMEERVHARIDNRFEFPDGSAGWFELSIEPVPEGIVVLSVDVTNRRLAEEQRERAIRELRDGEARYRRLVEHIREVVFAGGAEGPALARRLTFVSPQVAQLAGRTSGEFLADPGLWSRLLHPDDAAHVQRETERALARNEPVARFYRLRNEKTGEYRWIEDTFVPDQGDDGEPRGFFATARDITERWNAEAEAVGLRRRNELLLNSAGEGICGLDREGRVTFINPKGAGLLGYAVDELIGAPFHAKCHHSYPDGRPFPSEECPVHSLLAAERGYAGEAVFWRKAGGAVPVECVTTPIFDEGGTADGTVVMFQDISERHRLEDMVQQSQKLEAIGRLAGGVAHDFNNILGVITGYGELMGRQLDPGHPARPRLEQMLKAAERAAGLTRQLLAFSRKQVTQPRILDLNVLTSDLEKMLRRVIGEDVELEVRQSPGLGAVKADPTQVEQVVMNLVVNARDAMPKGGHLTIELANVEFDEGYAAEHPPAEV
jgi:two-component system, cell cycle sensor histidine kinase and response regulator CckA